MRFIHYLSIFAALYTGLNSSACDIVSNRAIDANIEMDTGVGMEPSALNTYAETAARELIKTFGEQEVFAMLGWQQGPDYEPIQHCFDYWYSKGDAALSLGQVQDCEQHVKDLSRLYASYGVDAKPVIFKSPYYWKQKRGFYKVWLELVETWKQQGGSKDNSSFLDHPVCAKPLQKDWLGSDNFYDGNEHPICRTLKLEALEGPEE